MAINDTNIDPDSDDDGPESIVEEARERFQKALDFYRESRMSAVEDTKFAWGDSDNKWQWPDDVVKMRAGPQRPALTINTTEQHCNQVMNAIRMNRPSCKVIPSDDSADPKTADIMGGLVRNIQATSSADDAHDVAADHAIHGGEGFWRILTEYESDTSFRQRIVIKPILNPNSVLIDPTAQELDKSDAEWGFVFEPVTREECKRKWPDIDPESWATDDHGWVKDDEIRLAEYFYCVYEPVTICQLPDGSVVPKDEVPKGIQIVKERATFIKKWKWAKLLGGEDQPVEETDWPGKYLPIIQVIGKELVVENKVLRKGLVRDLKDAARMVNYSYSAAIESLALQTKVPYMAAAESIRGYEQFWEGANTHNYAYLPFHAYDESGQQLPPPQRQPPALLPQAQIEMMRVSTEEMRAASGQQAVNFGIKSEASSGIGIQRLKQQGDIATFHFPDNLARALRHEGRVLVDLIPKIYDTQRVVRILGLDQKLDSAILDPAMQQAYGEYSQGDIQKIFNPNIGLYDVLIDTGPSFMTQRQEAADRLTELSTRNPQLMQLAGDLIVRSYDFHMADEIARRLESALPANLQPNKGKQQEIPPEVQQAMEAMTQQLQQAQVQAKAMADALVNAHKEVQQLEADAQNRDRELGIKEAEVEIKKIDALSRMSGDKEEFKIAADWAKAKLSAETQLLMKQLDGFMTPDAEFAAQVATDEFTQDIQEDMTP